MGLLTAFLCLTAMTSCNDDSDLSPDREIANDLPGTWILHEAPGTTSRDTRDVRLDFTASNFTATYQRKTDSRTYSYSVSGTWKVYKKVLELTYNVSTLSTTGMTAQEVDALTILFNDNNANLRDKPDTQPLGMNVEITRSYSNGTGSLRLSGYNPDFAGTYTLKPDPGVWPPLN